MRTSGIVIALMVVPLAGAQARPSVAEILKQVGEVYSTATQFRFVIHRTGEEGGNVTIVVRTPNQFRYETDGDVVGGDDNWGTVTMVSDGSTVWNYVAGLNRYTRKETSLPLLDTEPPEITPETFVFQAQAVFLTRIAEFAKATDRARLLRQETLSGIPCYVIQFVSPRPGFADEYTWWVDEKRHVIVREDKKPTGPLGRASSAVFSTASVGEPIPDDVFRFAPPAGSARVNKLAD